MLGAQRLVWVLEATEPIVQSVSVPNAQIDFGCVGRHVLATTRNFMRELSADEPATPVRCPFEGVIHELICGVGSVGDRLLVSAFTRHIRINLHFAGVATEDFKVDLVMRLSVRRPYT